MFQLFWDSEISLNMDNKSLSSIFQFLPILIIVKEFFDKKQSYITRQMIFKPMFIKTKWSDFPRFPLEVIIVKSYKIHLRPEYHLSLMDIVCKNNLKQRCFLVF